MESNNSIEELIIRYLQNEIQEDEQGYFVYLSGKRTSVFYSSRLDILTIASLGDYMRN